MGTWGTKLYDSDTTKDVRGDYIHKLKLKKSSAQTVEELLDAYASLMETDEEPLFWFALADTQWDYGRLLPFVLDKALYFLSDIPALEVTELWREQGRSYEDAWTKTLLKLQEKLQTPQPPEKKVLGYRLFRCKWAVGDVFAYRFSSDLSRETGFYGQYVLFQKVGEDTEWPGHIVPSVHVFQWSGNEIPDLGQLENINILPQGYFPSVLAFYPDTCFDYRINLLATSEKMIPQDNLTFLGKIPVVGATLPNKPQASFFETVAWSGKYNNTFEKYIIKRLIAWKDFDFSLISNYHRSAK